MNLKMLNGFGLPRISIDVARRTNPTARIVYYDAGRIHTPAAR